MQQMLVDQRSHMSENKFKEIYETPTLYGFLFDVEEQYQQDMENYLMRDTDVSYNSISTLRANVLGIKKCCPAGWWNDRCCICFGGPDQLHQSGYDQYRYPPS